MHSSPMRKLSLRPLATAVTAAVAFTAITGCNGESATGAAPDVRHAVASTTTTSVTVPLLTRTQRLAADVTYSIDVSGSGGTINIPEAGLQVRVPAGAFSGKKPIRFTVTALAGDVVAYRFGPHGMKFLKPLVATQDLSITTYDVGGSALLDAGYFASDADIDVSGRSAKISEIFPTAIATGNRARWEIPHFSGYVIATGRTMR